MKPLLNNAISLLEDARDYLLRMPEDAYCMSLPVLSGSTVGQHTRHFIEFFQCLFETLDAHEDKAAVLNYDRRRRDLRIETNPLHALVVVESLMERLQMLAFTEDIYLEFTDYEMGGISLLPTSVERELFYNIEHTIHHFALIKIGLRVVSPCLALPGHFGIAPSTLHRSPDVQA